MKDVATAGIDVQTCDLYGLRFSMQAGDDSSDGGRCTFSVRRLTDGGLVAWLVLGAPAVGRFDECVQAWIADRVGATPPAKVFCRGCGTELVPVAGLDTDYQFDNALWVSFNGGYGMFIDPVGDAAGVETRVVICHECAHRLCSLVPWVGEIIDPYGSHSHRATDLPALVAAGHRGWDIDHPSVVEGHDPATGTASGCGVGTVTS